MADAVFALPEDQLTTSVVWLGVLAYTLQIYFDFSGYSDMAIGLGRMIGFRLPENFARPYSAVSVTDFWRRWHMSLSRWFRDYVYIPLGGNRGSSLVTYRNLFTVFFLTGIWHGAAWTFIVWGLFHGVLLAFERATGLARIADETWQWPRRALTFLLVVVGWVFFRAADMGRALEMLRLMFVPRFGDVPAEVTTVLTDQRTLVFVLGMLVVLMPRDLVMGKVVDDGRTRSRLRRPGRLLGGRCAVRRGARRRRHLQPVPVLPVLGPRGAPWASTSVRRRAPSGSARPLRRPVASSAPAPTTTRRRRSRRPARGDGGGSCCSSAWSSCSRRPRRTSRACARPRSRTAG